MAIKNVCTRGKGPTKQQKKKDMKYKNLTSTWVKYPTLNKFSIFEVVPTVRMNIIRNIFHILLAGLLLL